MGDAQIVELYWQRDEAAIRETDTKYGRLCLRIARNILRVYADAEECVNDAYLGVWNTVPPQRPSAFRAFLCRITRNVALDRSDYLHAAKRNVDATQALEELHQVAVFDEEPLEEVALAQIINCFLGALDATGRNLFLWRYWYFDTVGTIAKRTGWSESKVTARLHRLRKKFRAHLVREGVTV